MSQNIVNGQYSPSFPPERALYESLWRYVNPSGGETLSGQDAVPFFQKSGVDIGILRQIWSSSTVNNIMKKENFFTALRYITMMQNGEIPLTSEKLVSSAGVQFPPPKFADVQLPQAPPPAAPAALPPPQAYAMTPEEQTKYLELFKSYDTARSGTLPQTVLMPIFSKSGLPPPLINAVWVLSDVDKDTQLSPIEFAIAFHLILCISKKHLPVPPGLPAPLLTLASSSRPVPSSAAPSQPVKQPVSAAFNDIAPHVEDVPVRRAEEQEIKPATATQPASDMSMSGGSLKYLLQRVVTEKISLSASITNSEADIENLRGRLTATLGEINGLESEIEELRQKLLDAYQQRALVQSDETRARAERERLALVVAEGRREMARLSGDSIEPSPLLGQFGERIATTAAEGVRQSSHSGVSSTELTAINAELDSLRATLNTLTTERTRVAAESQQLKNTLNNFSSTADNEQQQLLKQQQELSAVTAENQRLQSELDALLTQLASQNSVSVATVSAVPTPQPFSPSPLPVTSFSSSLSPSLPVSSPSSSLSVSETEKVSFGFESTAASVSHSGGSGFDDFGAPTSSGFDSFAAAPSSVSSSGFDDFGASPSVSSSGFDSFAAAPSVSSSGFDDFGAAAPSAGAADSFAAFGNSVSMSQPNDFSSFSSDFNAFGAAQSSPATKKTETVSSAFDAFDF